MKTKEKKNLKSLAQKSRSRNAFPRCAVKAVDVEDRRRECQRNVEDFVRSGNVYNSGYYKGYSEALTWILDGKQP